MKIVIYMYWKQFGHTIFNFFKLAWFFTCIIHKKLLYLHKLRKYRAIFWLDIVFLGMRVWTMAGCNVVDLSDNFSADALSEQITETSPATLSCFFLGAPKRTQRCFRSFLSFFLPFCAFSYINISTTFLFLSCYTQTQKVVLLAINDIILRTFVPKFLTK